jgi:hypothetical protein
MMRFRASWLALALTLAARPVAAQDPSSADHDPSSVELEHLQLGSIVPAAAVADLPLSNDLSALLETTQADVISDRIDDGGLTTGDAALVGAHGSSWTQTRFQLGEADVTDPTGSGTPLILPGVVPWERITVISGPAPAARNAPGLIVLLQPRSAAASWGGTFEGSLAPYSLLAGKTLQDPPPIARLNSWGSASLLASGPLAANRLGALVGATWTSATRFERADPTRLGSRVGSAFTHLEYQASSRDLIRTIGWLQTSSRPHPDRIPFGDLSAAQDASAAHVQTVWNRSSNSLVASLAAAYSARRRSDDARFTGGGVVERLRDGPVPALLYSGNGTARTWSVTGRLAPAAHEAFRFVHQIDGGAEVVRSSAQMKPAGSGLFGELVDGLPARVWRYDVPTGTSEWTSTTAAIYVTDAVQMTPTFGLNLGLRFETTDGSAAGAKTGVSWRNWLPRGSLAWKLTDFANIALVSGFGRYAYRLPLGDLAYGDPAAPTGDVYRWLAANAETVPTASDLGPLVARVGPGAGADGQLTSIDPALQRPYMDEYYVGFESRPQRATTVRLTAMARREKQHIGLVNVGAPISSYSTVQVFDRGRMEFDPADDQLLTAYSRLPESFGADRYVLTNPTRETMTFVGVELSAQTRLDRLFLIVAGTAGRSNGFAQNRGFQAIENDQGSVGELFADPNALTNAHGRLFTERGYTAKVTGTYAFGHDVRLGIVARYQDGQMFSRMVIFPTLNQGPEAVRAFANGLTRFTYVLTADARLQKRVTVGTRKVDLIADVFNLLNTANEVEEDSVAGPEFRRTTAVQPPRTVHLGIRLTF